MEVANLLGAFYFLESNLETDSFLVALVDDSCLHQPHLHTSIEYVLTMIV